MIDWRDKHAPGREMWVSEFGWDCSTQKPDPKGDMAKFITCSDEEQAMWLVRSYLLFAEMRIDKAFVYFFNDEDKASFHACSGITRHFQPKPSYHAIAWMLRNLADYRFSRAIQKSEKEGYLFEFISEQPKAPKILAAWHATRDGVSLDLHGAEAVKSERMPMTSGPGAETPLKSGDSAVMAGTVPTFIWVE
jgi:hypothetical protein